MKTAEFELVDGIWPDTDTYMRCLLPYEWLTDEAYVDGEDCEEYESTTANLADLIEKRLSEGVDGLRVPTPAMAVRTITALRKYADYLEREFIFVPASDRDG